MYPSRSRKSHPRNMVQRRVGESPGERLPNSTNARSMAFSRILGRIVQRLCAHLPQLFKIKQESSGYPNNCTTEEQKQQYVDEYLAVEGIQLDRSKIEHNPSMRALSKLMLNSFWGMYSKQLFSKRKSFLGGVRTRAKLSLQILIIYFPP
jgi:hypothetical protein